MPPARPAKRRSEEWPCYADELDAKVQIHLHETKAEVTEARRSLGQHPIRVLEDVGLLTENLQAVHMTAVSAVEIAMIAECGASVVHCPMSNTKLASGICPVPAFREAGVTVALGTDGAASNNGLDLFHEARMADIAGKTRQRRPGDAMPAAEALEMATLGGARALGMADRIGSLGRPASRLISSPWMWTIPPCNPCTTCPRSSSTPPPAAA